MTDFSDYIVYVDESGDHGLRSMDPAYPIFVLAFCVFPKSGLAEQLVPHMLRLKFRHFGHDQVVLHESEIRKSSGPFRMLLNATNRHAFFDDLNELMAIAPVTIIAVVIRKEALTDRYARPDNPYHLALSFGLERVCRLLSERGQRGRLTHVVCERRGDREDHELELEFRRVVAGTNDAFRRTPLEILFADKRTISTGLQFADLVARPIGLRVLRPSQPNRAYEILSRHFRRSPAGEINGWGLKIFPTE